MPPPRLPAQTPGSQPLAQALQGSEPLAALLLRVQESSARLAAVSGMLPAGLRQSVRAGPLDETGWVLLVDNAAAAAKLRQLLPALASALLAAGFGGPEPRVRIQARPGVQGRPGGKA